MGEYELESKLIKGGIYTGFGVWGLGFSLAKGVYGGLYRGLF